MLIINRTAYTFDRLYEFNKRHLSFWRPLFIVLYAIMGVCMTVALLLQPIVQDLSVCIVSTAVLLFCILSILRLTVWFKRNVRKQPAINSVSEFRFTEDGMEEQATGGDHQLSSQTRMAYSGILRVTESENAYYLYISPNMAHIVAKDGFIEGSREDFEDLLRTKIEPKKLKWKEPMKR